MDPRHLALWLSLCATSFIALAGHPGFSQRSTAIHDLPTVDDAVSSGCAQRATKPYAVAVNEASRDSRRASTALEETARPQRPATPSSPGRSPRGRARGGIQSYDARELPTRVVDALGGQWHWSYDADGRLVGRSDALGQRTQFEWTGHRLIGARATWTTMALATRCHGNRYIETDRGLEDAHG